MHIPSVIATSQLEITDFYTALRQSMKKCDRYDISKWLYVPNLYKEYRYILGKLGSNPLICIGINPSTAEPDNLDNTLKSVERISQHNGYDGFIMFNIYAQRATNPDDMELLFNRNLHAENMKAFEYILNLYSDGQTPSVWAAWGTIIEKRCYLFECLNDMIELGNKYGASWFTAGKKSKTGHPHHPLYLKKDSLLDAFDAKYYLDSFLRK